MSDPPDGGRSGIYAELAVQPDCPVATVASEIPLREFVPATGSGLPRFIVERSAEEPAERDRLQPVTRTGESVVCRVREGAGCSHDWCPVCDPGGLPLDPLGLHWDDGELHLNVAARDGDAMRRCVDAIGEEFEVTPVRISTAEGSPQGLGRRAVLDLGELTDRQRELARIAADRDYFDSDGPTAETVAEELDITKSTLSEHLRAVQRELFDQLF